MSLKKTLSIFVVIFVAFFNQILYASEASSEKLMAPLFDKPSGQFYNYAPCYIQTDNDTRYVYYCANQNSGEIVDFICWRKAIKENGLWLWGEQNIAFGPSENSWDMCHVCDPDIVKGSFWYKGKHYSWAMTYLGVAQWDCKANQIGIAFSESIEGPWVKFENNPIISCPNTYSWGVGQDSMISLNNEGRFRIVYRYSDGTDDFCRYKDFDFSDADNYTESPHTVVSRDGLINNISHTCPSHVTYDSVNEIYYIAAEHVWDEPRRCCREILIGSLEKDAFENGTGTWDVVYRFNQSNTGYVGNHNASFLRDSFGKNDGAATLGVAMSSSDNSGLWSFQINEAYIRVNPLIADTAFSNGHAYKFLNKETGTVLDNWNAENGSQCYMHSWTEVHNQQWILSSLGGNNYKIINRWTDKALDNFENSTPDIVYIWENVLSPDQTWEILPVSANYYKVKNIATGRYLTGTTSQNGAAVLAQSSSCSDKQLWEIIDLGPVDEYEEIITSGSTYRLVNKATGDVLDNWNAENGASCYSYIWTKVDNQKWLISSTPNGNFKIINSWTDKALDCYEETNGAIAYTWEYVGNPDQLWEIVHLGNGEFKLLNQKTGRALTQSIQGNGNSIFCWDFLGDPSQIWYLIKESD